MPALNRLTSVQVRKCGPGKYADGGGIWLVKRQDGGAQWILRVTVHGRRREMGLGRLADVSLKEARESAERWRAVVRQGDDPIKFVSGRCGPEPVRITSSRTSPRKPSRHARLS